MLSGCVLLFLVLHIGSKIPNASFPILWSVLLSEWVNFHFSGAIPLIPCPYSSSYWPHSGSHIEMSSFTCCHCWLAPPPHTHTSLLPSGSGHLRRTSSAPALMSSHQDCVSTAGPLYKPGLLMRGDPLYPWGPPRPPAAATPPTQPRSAPSVAPGPVRASLHRPKPTPTNF